MTSFKELDNNCIDIIFMFLKDITPPSILPRVALKCLFIGNKSFTCMGYDLLNHIEPGYRKYCEKKYNDEVKYHQNISFETLYDEMMPKQLLEYDQSTRYVDLVNICRILGYVRKPTKKEIIDMLDAKKDDIILKIKKILDYKPKLVYTLSDSVKSYYNSYNNKRITYTRVKTEYMLNNKDLLNIQYDEARNPHGKSLAPMKLYKLNVIEEIQYRKYGSLTNITKERERRIIKYRKTRNPYQNE